MKLELFPPDIIDEYGLRDKVDTDGNVSCEVRCGMYGLPQAGILAQDLLTKRLYKAGYRQSKITPGYWRQDWCPISFTLVVDDFGVKCTNKDDVYYLVNILMQTTRSTLIGKARDTLASCLIGTMPHTRSIDPCQGALKRPAFDSAMYIQQHRRCNPTPTQCPPMAQQYNMQRQ
jgi:hypothetical protein